LGIALFIGIPAGIMAALRKNTWLDYLPMSLSMAGICLPTFVLGPLLIYIFSTQLGLFPPLGWYGPSDWFLPSFTLGLFYAAYVARLTRAGMLETLQQDYVRTARAKGATPWRVVTRHALRGGLLPVVTYLGPAFAGLISGSFVIESIFFIPGLGKFFVTAAFNRDYTMVLGTVLFYASLIILLNLLVDLLQAWIDPKARQTR
jgi:oligopeptide transport system permease protein